MKAEDLPEFDPALDLVLVRDLAAPRSVIWACWTRAEHLAHWFVPRPHRVTACHLDLRVGGAFDTTFEVEGKVMENRGVYLEVVPEERLVFTDAYRVGWKPAPEPFMTAIVTFEDIGGGRTRYTAVARHRSAEMARQHAEMGFQQGWGTVAMQLEAHARGLAG
jgi:uncharacterized protein YndB with AHSA1/START domain